MRLPTISTTSFRTSGEENNRTNPEREPEVLRHTFCLPRNRILDFTIHEHPRAVHPTQEGPPKVAHRELEGSPVLRNSSHFRCRKEGLRPVIHGVVVDGALEMVLRSSSRTWGYSKDLAAYHANVIVTSLYKVDARFDDMIVYDTLLVEVKDPIVLCQMLMLPEVLESSCFITGLACHKILGYIRHVHQIEQVLEFGPRVLVDE